MSYKDWQKDPEFQKLGKQDQFRIYAKHFDDNMADDDFRALPPATQNVVRKKYMEIAFGVAKPAAEPEKGFLERADAAFKDFSRKISRSPMDNRGDAGRTVISGAPIVGRADLPRLAGSQQAVNAPVSRGPGVIEQGGRNMADAVRSMQGVKLEDMGRSLGIGLSRTGQLLGRGLDAAGLDRAGQSLEQYYKGREQGHRENLSEAFSREKKKEFIEVDPATGKYKMGAAWTSLPKIMSTIVESAPTTALGMGTGLGFTGALTKVGVSSGLAGIIGGGLGEGGVAAAESAKTAYDTVIDAPIEQLAGTKEYIEAYQAAGDDLSHDERDMIARKAVASGAAAKAGLITGAATGILGAPSGHFMGKAIGGETGKTMLRTALKQAGLETLQEMPQSAAERLVQNITEKQYVDPGKDIWEGVGEAMAEGGVSGFVMGAGMGGGTHVMGRARAAAEQTAEQEQEVQDVGQAAGPADQQAGKPAPLGSNAAEVSEAGRVEEQGQEQGQETVPVEAAPKDQAAPVGSSAAEVSEAGQVVEQEQDVEEEEGDMVASLSEQEMDDALSILGGRVSAKQQADIAARLGEMQSVEEADAAFPGMDAGSMYARIMARRTLPSAAEIETAPVEQIEPVEAPEIEQAAPVEPLETAETEQVQPVEDVGQVAGPADLQAGMPAPQIEQEQDYEQEQEIPAAEFDEQLAEGLEPMAVEQYSVKPTDAGVTLDEVREVFKGAPVSQEADGSYRVKIGRRDVTIRNVERIDVNEAAFKLGYGRRISTAEKAAGAAGAYKDGEIRISRAGDRWTLKHETYHFLETSGFLTQNDIAALDRAIGNGRRKVSQEDRALWIEDALQRREHGRSGIVGRILQKIGDLVDGMANLVMRTDRGVLRDMESGRAFDQNPALDLNLDHAQNIEQEQDYEQDQGVEQAVAPDEQAEQYRLAPVMDEVFDIDQDTAGDKVRKAAVAARDAVRADAVKDRLDKTVTRMIDRLHPLKKLGDLPYKLERMATGVQSALEMFFKHGQLEYEGMAPTVRQRNQGAVQFFESLGEDLYKFFGWASARRAEQIEQQDMQKYTAEFSSGQTTLSWTKWQEQFGRVEKRLTAQKRAEIFQWTANGPKDFNSWEDINDRFMEYNQNVIEFAVRSELMSRETADRLLKADFYVPFYRVLQDEQARQEFLGGPRSGGKNIDAVIKELKGSEKKIGDPLANIMKNWSSIITESIRNVSRASAFDSAVGRQITVTDMNGNAVPIIQQVSMKQALEMKNEGVMSFQRLGKKLFFKVNDAELYNAMSNANKVDNYISKVFGGAKRLTTFGATVVPVFRLRNGLRDTLHVAVTSRSFLPFIDTMKGMWSVFKEDADYIAYMASCAGFGNNYIQADDPLAAAKYINKMAKKAGKKSIILDTPLKLWEMYEKVGEAMETGARVEIYKKRRREGVSHLEAAFEGRDLLDFTMRGDSKAIQYLIQTVPFMNARIQGLYKLGTSFRENPMGFAVKGGLVALASLALWAHNREDERYKALEEWEKRTYYHFWTPNGHHVVFPKPFEVGALFSTTVEAAMDAMAGDEDIEYLAGVLKHTALETFSMNPLPQLIKPALEVTMNKSFFTGRAIDSPADLRLPAGERGSHYTSETMRVLGEKFGFSPKRGEALVRGYFASFGRDMLSMSDIFFRQFGDFPIQPTSKLDDMYFVGSFIKEPGPAKNTKYMQRFFDAATEVNEVVAAVNKYRHLGDMDKVKKYMAQPEYKFKKIAGSTQRVLSDISRQMRKIYADRNMDAEKKRKLIDTLSEKKNRIVKNFYDVWRKRN